VPWKAQKGFPRLKKPLERLREPCLALCSAELLHFVELFLVAFLVGFLLRGRRYSLHALSLVSVSGTGHTSANRYGTDSLILALSFSVFTVLPSFAAISRPLVWLG
jgi:hypothetical protein